MKTIEQYFHVVLFIMLYKVVLTFKSEDETLVCDQQLHVAQSWTVDHSIQWDQWETILYSNTERYLLLIIVFFVYVYDVMGELACSKFNAPIK